MYTRIRKPMACTECPSYKADSPDRTAVAYQPREVGRYQSLPYTLLCRFHLSALKMQNAQRTKKNERWGYPSHPGGFQYTLETWLDITDDIRAQEQARYEREVKERDEAKAEQDKKAAQADREYTRNAKSRARSQQREYSNRRFVSIDIVREEVAREYSNAAYIRYGIDATTDDGTGTKVERLGWVTVSLPTYNTWDSGKFVPSRVQYNQGESAWLFSPDLIRGYVAQAMTLAMAEAARLNAGWLK